jgi:hypothetical protein
MQYKAVPIAHPKFHTANFPQMEYPQASPTLVHGLVMFWTFAQGGPLLTSIVLGVEILQTILQTYITASFVPYRREMDDS